MRNLTSQMEQVVDAIEKERRSRKEFMERHAETAEREEADRKEFVSSLKEQVADLRKGNQADIKGAHRVWSNFTAGRGEFREVAAPAKRTGKKGKR